MSEFPLISVIVPAYNAEKWLKECADSVLGQSYPHWELIIVDDGSTDGTGQLARELAREKENIHTIHTENGGVCRARNTGMDAAAGEYIVFLDADDLLLPHALQTLYAALTGQKGDIAVGWKTNVKPDGTELGCPYPRESRVFTGTEGLEYSLRDHPSLYAVWGKLYKKEVLNGLRFAEGKKVHEDSFFLFQCMLRQPKTVLCEEIVLRYRISENSASRAAFSDTFFDILYFAEEKMRLVNEQYPALLPLAENTIVKANMALLQNLCRADGTTYAQAEKQCIREIRRYKKSFQPATSFDRKWFWVVTHGLYGAYKWLRRLRHAVSNSKFPAEQTDMQQ